MTKNNQNPVDSEPILEFVDDQIPMPEPAQHTMGEPTLEEKYQAALIEIERLKNEYLRAHADAENMKKRVMQDMENAKKYAVAPLAREIFGVIDTLESALKAIPQSARDNDKNMANLAMGLDMTMQMVQDAFARVVIKAGARIGDKFDPNFHQAVSESPASDTNPTGTIVNVMQQGYILHDRLLRPAMVVVAK